jgi:hypothetical protein
MSVKQIYIFQAKQNYFCNDILNTQIKKEFEASQTYLALVTKFILNIFSFYLNKFLISPIIMLMIHKHYMDLAKCSNITGKKKYHMVKS